MEKSFLSFYGRISRRTYAVRAFIGGLIMFIVAYGVLESIPELLIIGVITVTIIGMIVLIQFIKRLHDIGMSGLYALVSFIPIANVVFGLYVLFKNGDLYANKYGPYPLNQVSQNQKQEGTHRQRIYDSDVLDNKVNQESKLPQIGVINPVNINDMDRSTENIIIENPIDEDWLISLAEKDLRENLTEVSFPCHVVLKHRDKKFYYRIDAKTKQHFTSSKSDYLEIKPDSAIAIILNGELLNSFIKVGEHQIEIVEIFRK